jgi:hypothetical protein
VRTLDAYIECAMWSSTGDDGESLDALYGPDDLAPETLESMKGDVEDFLALIDREGIDRSWWSDEQLGHDFWLTRNRHGAGFWDRSQGGPGDKLTALAHSYGESNLYVGDDGLVYVS